MKKKNVFFQNEKNRIFLDENWENARKEKNTRLHLIKPMELEMNVDKCIYNDDAILPAYEKKLFF